VRPEKSTRVEVEVGHKGPYQLEITRQDVAIRGLPRELHGATFAHVSDIHGGFAGLERVYEEALAHVNAASPELIFFTGDFIDKRSTQHEKRMIDLLKRFRAERGVFACLGNHDHLRGETASRRLLDDAGIRLLVNESVRLDSGLWVAGIDDLHEGRPDISRTFAGLPADRTSIVLSHNPRLIRQAGGRDVVILSGHTHGAQFRLRFPTPRMICYLHLRCWQVAGWYRNGAARLYVNRGLGVTGKPYRIDCPAEIGIFRMVPDPADPTYLDRPTETEAAPAAAGRT
jgi:predicted MPP superfamily phosphohydrolase